MLQAEADRQVNDVMSRISFATDLEAARDCDLVVEAIIEHMPIKIDFYTRLGKIIKPEAVFASNTSSLAITGMAEASGRPNNFIGLHFFNPVQVCSEIV